jgi:hypothetical protein
MPYPSCLRDSCVIVDHKECVLGELSALDEALDASKKGNHAHWSFMMSKNGYLGAHNRVKIPDCFVLFT